MLMAREQHELFEYNTNLSHSTLQGLSLACGFHALGQIEAQECIPYINSLQLNHSGILKCLYFTTGDCPCFGLYGFWTSVASLLPDVQPPLIQTQFDTHRHLPNLGGIRHV
jgi:hypothetical protein